MKTKLITALRIAAKALEEGTFDYDWNEQNRCNVGILACSITGLSADELAILSPIKDGEWWIDTIGHACPLTGMPRHALLKTLFLAGLNHNSIKHLEELGDPVVVAKVLSKEGAILIGKSVTNPDRKAWHFWKPKQITVTELTPKRTCLEKDNPDDVAAYMRAWADLLVEEGKMDVPENAEASIVSTVEVPPEVRKAISDNLKTAG